LFGVGWWDEDRQEFRVGLSIPKPTKKSVELPLPMSSIEEFVE
jgi:hypothetical protein